MLRIIGERGCGKTSQLLHYAAENEAIFVCLGNVGYAKYLAENYKFQIEKKYNSLPTPNLIIHLEEVIVKL